LAILLGSSIGVGIDAFGCFIASRIESMLLAIFKRSVCINAFGFNSIKIKEIDGKSIVTNGFRLPIKCFVVGNEESAVLRLPQDKH
jgi:hypothetical protein